MKYKSPPKSVLKRAEEQLAAKRARFVNEDTTGNSGLVKDVRKPRSSKK